MKIPVLSLILFLGIISLAHSDRIISKIELSDGSIIEGEIVSLGNGVYSVNTESLGKVEINASKVSRIMAENAKINPPATNTPPAAETQDIASDESLGSEMQRMQSKITQDPEAMKTVVGMLFDPQFQEILKDPVIVNAVKAQDIKALMQNEKFMSLMDNQNIRELQERLKKQEE